MPPQIGYLLPTRERVMEGRPETASLLDLAARAESLGFDSVWVGDSLLARPRHDPLTLLAAVAARTQKATLGTAVFLPALRNPVVLAHQLATLDQISEGRLVLGAGIASDVPNIRAEFAAAGVPFEGRVGRMMEGLRLARALWTGKPVDWQGRWPVQAACSARPRTARRAADLDGGVGAARARAGGRHFDGWFANEADLGRWTGQWAEVQQILSEAGRDPGQFVAAIYVTLAIDEDASRAIQRIDAFLERYYGQPAEAMRRRQACYGGPHDGAADILRASPAGASHIIVRLVGDPDRQLETVAGFRAQLGITVLHRETGAARRQADAAAGRLDHVIAGHLHDVGAPIELLRLVFEKIRAGEGVAIGLDKRRPGSPAIGASRQPNFQPACSAPMRQRSRRTARVLASSASSAGTR